MNDESLLTTLFGINPSGHLSWIKEQKDFLQASPASQRVLSYLERSQPSSLYYQRYSAWLQSSYATYAKPDQTQQVCRYWSEQCDQILIKSWKDHGLQHEPLALFALGKLGAQELNLSSDVDLMIVSDSSPTAESIKKLRLWKNSLEVLTENGWLFRVDLDLRPGGAKSPMITSLQQFQDYYWSYGESWERLALIRLRPLCGQDAIQQEVLDLRLRFSFPKYHHKNVVDDLLNLRQKIFDNNQKQQKETLHLKLQPGGIRDIELCVHAMQALLGGRQKELQTASTEEAFHRFNKPEFLKLRQIYWQLRQYENQVQAVEDQQKHDMDYKNLPEGWTWPKENELLKLMQESEQIVLKILKPTDEESVQIPVPHLIDQDTQEEIWPRLTSLAELHSKAGQQCLKDFIDQLNLYPGAQDQALLLILELFKSFRFHKEYFQVFASQQNLIKDLVNLFIHAPTLGHYLARRPDVFDDFLQRKHNAQSTEAQPETETTNALDLVEKKLVFEAIYAQDFIRNKDMVATTTHLSKLTDQLLTELLARTSQDIELVALGKWGGQELGFRSDIDFIFLSKDPAAVNKQARSFISSLSEHTASGKLYNLDLRLRPSGQSGPVIVTAESWLEYIENGAPAWQRQAYLKSRLLANNADFKKTKLPALTAEDTTELKRIHKQLCEQNHLPEEYGVDLKYHPGGLLSVEFFVQWYFLKNMKWPNSPSTLGQLEQMQLELGKKELLQLKNNYMELRKAEQYVKLNSSQSTAKLKWDSVYFSNLCLWLEQSQENYKIWLLNTLKDNQKIIQSLDPL